MHEVRDEKEAHEGKGEAATPPSSPEAHLRAPRAARTLSLRVWVLLGGMVLIVALAGALFFIPAPQEREQENQTGSAAAADGYTKENCVADECLAVAGLSYPAGPLPQEAEEALLQSLGDTYTAIALYSGAMERLGPVMPFINIVRTEQHYLAALKALFDKYGVAIPENDKFSRALPPKGITFSDACATLLEFERSSVVLYEDTLLPRAAAYPDILKVFTAFARASRTLHMPALARCAEEANTRAEGA